MPPAVMRDAKGLAILTMTKAGFIVSGRGGTGIAIARTESTSNPNDSGPRHDRLPFSQAVVSTVLNAGKVLNDWNYWNGSESERYLIE